MYLLRNMPLKQCFLGGYISPTAAPDCVGLAIFRWRLTTPRQGVFFGDGDSVKNVFKKGGKRCSKVI